MVTGRVNRPLETLAEAHWEERGCFLRTEDPVYGELLLAAPPWKMSGRTRRLAGVALCSAGVAACAGWSGGSGRGAGLGVRPMK